MCGRFIVTESNSTLLVDPMTDFEPRPQNHNVAPGEVCDRKPARLTADGYDDWLGDHLAVDELLQLLDREPFAVAHDLTHYEVTRDVNSVRNNGPQLIEPLA